MRAVATVFLLVLLAGCGGSSDDFAQDAADICRKANERVTALGTPESFTDTLLYARQSEDAVGDQLDELRELDPPDGVQDEFDAYLATLEERRTQLDRLSDAADRSNMADIQGIGSELNRLTVQAKAQARRAGLTGCE